MKKCFKYLFTLIIAFSTFFIIDNVYADDAKLCIYDYEGKKDNVHIIVDNDGYFLIADIKEHQQGTLYNVDKADKGTFVARDNFLKNGYKTDEELYIRWLETSLLCPMMQFSISPNAAVTLSRHLRYTGELSIFLPTP